MEDRIELRASDTVSENDELRRWFCKLDVLSAEVDRRTGPRWRRFIELALLVVLLFPMLVLEDSWCETDGRSGCSAMTKQNSLYELGKSVNQYNLL